MAPPSLVLVLLLASLTSYAYLHNGIHNYYVLHHDPVYASLAYTAEILGVRIVEPVGDLSDFWLARTETPGNDTLRPRVHTLDDPVIETYRRLRYQSSLRRGGLNMSLAIKHLSLQESRTISHRSPIPKRATTSIEDPLFRDQWYLEASSLNVIPVWERLKITGKGIIIAVLDGGIRSDHKDLESNLVSAYSKDFIGGATQGTNGSVHGTACAGVIAAAKNDICGVGIAYDSKIADLRVLTSAMTLPSAAQQALALNHKYQDVSIYSSSFGPPDNGKAQEGPPYVVNKAFLNGVSNGRMFNGKAKGSIYVIAAGNGRQYRDECNHDGYVNSIYTIAIGALGDNGRHAEYSEDCTAVMAVAYGGGDHGGSIVSVGTTSDEACNEKFNGTSAAAPAAAAIFALALEIRPELTWRDIQYLCVETAKHVDGLMWETLPSGREYSPLFGFGALDAYAFVKEAKTWTLVKPQVWIKPPYAQLKDGTVDVKGVASGGEPFSSTRPVSHTFEITEAMAKRHDFDKVEHVQLRVWIQYPRRGDITVRLHSPKITLSVVGRPRPYDDAQTGLAGWTFSTLKHWGEDPVGLWLVSVKDESNSGLNSTGVVLGFSLTIWGSAKTDSPNHKPYEMPADDDNVFP